jgi:hypothetical protein
VIVVWTHQHHPERDGLGSRRRGGAALWQAANAMTAISATGNRIRFVNICFFSLDLKN